MRTFSSGLAAIVLLAQGLTAFAGPGTAPHRTQTLTLAGSLSGASGPVHLVLFQPAPPLPPLPPNPPNIISSRRLIAKDPNVVAPDVQKMPSQWLGIRLTPIPEPLAAHIGDHGVMIANVVKDSPADQAGLERYDVIVSLDSQQVADSQALFAALEAVKAGQSVPLTVIRTAQKTDLTITPAERPTDPQVKWKYDEPDASVIDRQMRLHGHKLVPGPGGGWQWEELGPLNSFPDFLRDLDLPDFDQFMNIDPFAQDEPDQDVKARIEVRVQVDENGGTLTIWRDKDGKINVKRIDPDGNESSATYENMDEFQKADPEAFKAYRPFSSRGPDSWTFVQPQRETLGKLRQDFQTEIETKLRDALERAKAAEEEASKAVEGVRERLEQFRSSTANSGNVDEQRTRIETHTFSVKIENGHITVTVDDGDGPQTYEFQSKEEFKQQKPELYDRCKQLLE
jgi:membrane-associated protease RseP (regulator of RpoE activity)